MVRALRTLVPPQSVGLPPGAGNKTKKAIQPKEEEPADAGDRYVDEACVPQRERHAAAVCREHDSGMAAARSLGQVQRISDDERAAGPARGVRAV